MNTGILQAVLCHITELLVVEEADLQMLSYRCHAIVLVAHYSETTIVEKKQKKRPIGTKAYLPHSPLFRKQTPTALKGTLF